MTTEKDEFLKLAGDEYGYPNAPKSIDEIRASEFKRLDGLVYLDHAGATLYSELQMESILKDLSTVVYGNPHSQSDSSLFTSDVITDARLMILDYCNASIGDYRCIFTSGATGALKLLGEAFPWSSQSCFMYTMENHNSVLGIREYAFRRGAAAIAVDIEEVSCLSAEFGSPSSSFKASEHPVQRRSSPSFVEENSIGNVYNLFAFPSECNFSGVRFNAEMVNVIKDDPRKFLEGSTYCNGRWMVLIDAAKGCSTDPPDLSKHPADFVVISFYKLFGYPTGLGALIVRNDAANLLRKTYFGGGTVATSIADIDYIKRREGIEESFEYGTISFLSIASVNHGFKILNMLGKSAIYRHTTLLATFVRKQLAALRHENGTEVCRLYGKFYQEVFPRVLSSIVTFNFRRPNGLWFGHREVERLASLSGIQLRTGCFCNPGACSKYLGLSHSDLYSNIEAGHVCWDDLDIVHGKPTGAVRISFGYMSTFEDAKRFIDFAKAYFVSSEKLTKIPQQLRTNSTSFCSEGVNCRSSISRFCLKSINVYPVKSCAGFCVESWPLCSTGLQHDREWLLKSHGGEILTQKKVPEMCLISTSIDLGNGILFLESPRNNGRLQINLKCEASSSERKDVDIHDQRYEVQINDVEVNTWFSNAVGRPCILFRCFSSQIALSLNETGKVGFCRNVDPRLNFVNEAQFLLVSEESLSDLNSRMHSKAINATRFRPNLIVSGGEPYSEDEWRKLKIGDNYFTCLGGCNRCQMINVDHREDKVHKSNEPLATLASYRRAKGKILFGILLRYDNDSEKCESTNPWIQVGLEVIPCVD